MLASWELLGRGSQQDCSLLVSNKSSVVHVHEQFKVIIPKNNVKNSNMERKLKRKKKWFSVLLSSTELELIYPNN
jgi:hypothetical protein